MFIRICDRNKNVSLMHAALISLIRKLRTMIEERRGMLWMQELMKKIQEREEAGSGDKTT